MNSDEHLPTFCKFMVISNSYKTFCKVKVKNLNGLNRFESGLILATVLEHLYSLNFLHIVT